MARALAAGALTAAAVLFEAPKVAEDNPSEHPDEHHETEVEAVASLTARRLAALPTDPWPTPSFATYDALLRNPRKDTASP